MNKMLAVILFMALFYLQQTHAINAPINASCMTVDSENRQWVVNSSYGLTAMNKSFDACKKESKFPTTCKVIKERCDRYIKEASLETKWQCTALDQQGNPWHGTGSAKQDHAALAAKAHCRRSSPLPDSCYINLITCKKISE